MKNEIDTNKKRDDLIKGILPAITEFFDKELSPGYIETLTGMLANYPEDGPESTTISNIVNLITNIERPGVMSVLLKRIDETDEVMKEYQSFMGENTNNPNQ